MWLSVEMWDELAKKTYAEIKKGRPLRGMGYIIQNKWTDKDSGEERKMYKVRITKMLNLEEFDTVHEILEDSDGTRQTSFTPSTDSGFASEFPDADDQTSVYGSKPSVADEVKPTSSYGYSYKKRSPAPVQQPAPRQPVPVPGPTFAEPSQIPPPGSGDGQKVWESLRNSYPGMIKADDNANGNTRPTDKGPEWG